LDGNVLQLGHVGGLGGRVRWRAIRGAITHKQITSFPKGNYVASTIQKVKMKSSKREGGRNLLDGGREDGDSSKGAEDKKGNTSYVHFMVVDLLNVDVKKKQ
jgi:hypothetical protein